LTEKLIEFVAHSKRFAPHFHIPLQSGNNEILGQMRRRYQRELYVDRVNQIKRLMPDACIGVDVIVGFPGESDKHFLDTYAFLVDLPVSYLHVFSYSERPNTPAAEMKNQVSKTIKNKRSKMLRGLSAKKRHAFYESQLQKTKTILFEAENKEGYIQGFTENYVKVRIPWDPTLQNQTRSATLAEIDNKGMVRLAKSVLV
jgi:threonylcarbamoyladenosine tRNA methylthiotransferase MtaB